MQQKTTVERVLHYIGRKLRKDADGNEVISRHHAELAARMAFEGATASHWHKVVDGDLPTSYVRCLLANHKGMCVGYMLDNEGIILDSGDSFASTIDEVDYWMEIPELPE